MKTCQFVTPSPPIFPPMMVLEKHARHRGALVSPAVRGSVSRLKCGSHGSCLVDRGNADSGIHHRQSGRRRSGRSKILPLPVRPGDVAWERVCWESFSTWPETRGAESVFLEVRESNRAARALYEKWAFAGKRAPQAILQGSRRRRYSLSPCIYMTLHHYWCIDCAL